MKKNIKNMVLAAMFLAIGLVLPLFTGQIPQVGNMLLPMHIPVFLCGLICGWQYGGGGLYRPPAPLGHLRHASVLPLRHRHGL